MAGAHKRERRRLVRQWVRQQISEKPRGSFRLQMVGYTKSLPRRSNSRMRYPETLLARCLYAWSVFRLDPGCEMHNIIAPHAQLNFLKFYVFNRKIMKNILWKLQHMLASFCEILIPINTIKSNIVYPQQCILGICSTGRLEKRQGKHVYQN